MAKMSLLDMTQNILSAMDGDNVNSIDDTMEAQQVATIIQECYYDLMASREWPFLQGLTQLVGLGDTANPTKMQIPEGVNKVSWIKYNKKDVCYLQPFEFRSMIVNRVALSGVVDADGYGLNHDPEYWTTYDDKYIWFDSRDSSLDSTLMQSKSDAYVLNVASWTHEDAFTPDIPEKFFPTLLAEAKATAFINLKQQANAREERRAQRGRVSLRGLIDRTEDGVSRYNEKVNYGRK